MLQNRIKSEHVVNEIFFAEYAAEFRMHFFSMLFLFLFILLYILGFINFNSCFKFISAAKVMFGTVGAINELREKEQAEKNSAARAGRRQWFSGFNYQIIIKFAHFLCILFGVASKIPLINLPLLNYYAYFMERTIKLYIAHTIRSKKSAKKGAEEKKWTESDFMD